MTAVDTGAAETFKRLLCRYDENPEKRQQGLDWPGKAETMIGMDRLGNIQLAVETCLRDNIPGDLIECGVWRGGAVIFMRWLLKRHGVGDRKVWVADSFEGCPEPDPRYHADAADFHSTYGFLAVPMEQVRVNFALHDLLDDQVQFLPGWFEDTLPGAPIERLAVLRLDGDMYSSTTHALEALYPKLSPGGFAIIDDWGIPSGCQQAVKDYRTAHGIADKILDIDGNGVYWRKT